ncbi:MAG: VCBS repeat-containing protein [Sedimentisphaerales bacterium]
MDGDGDVDVLSASSSYNGRDGKIAWYENDGAGQFGSPQVITTQAHGAKCVYAADLDGDGDPDVLSASWLSWGESDKVAWYENDRTLQFGPSQVIGAEADGPSSVHAADMDGDGDMDVLLASSGDKKLPGVRTMELVGSVPRW